MTPYGATNRYVTDAVSTMSPAQLLVALYDRLVLDLDRATHAFTNGQPAGTFLLHAQDIVLELRTSLDVEAWDGGPGLAALYGWMHSELVAANVARDDQKVVAVRGMVADLRDAWKQAATQVSTEVSPALQATA